MNWANTDHRALTFRGTIGELSRAGGAFHAELRGLTEALNQPQGRAFQRSCSAVLGDVKCGFDLTQPGFSEEIPLERVTQNRIFRFSGLSEHSECWFEKGRLTVLSGAAKGLVSIIKNDCLEDGQRVIETWQQIPLPLLEGDMIRLEAGCDKRGATCRLKFANFVNFRGFPDIPGEDWLTSYPVSTQANTGGSLVR